MAKLEPMRHAMDYALVRDLAVFAVLAAYPAWIGIRAGRAEG